MCGRAPASPTRIQDLRYAFASLLASGGMTLPIIGRLLGHTQVQTTQRYAHLHDNLLRAGVERLVDLLRPRLRIVGRAGDGRAEP